MIDRIKKFIQEKPQFAILVLVFIGFAIFLLIFLLGGDKKRGSGEITEDQIKIQKGDDIVIVNKSGLVEYRSGDRVFYRTWDADRVSSFFSSMELKARESVGKSPPSGEYYTVTLYLDGELIVIYVEVGDGVLDEVFEEIESDGDGGGLGDYFNDDDSDENGTGDSTSSSPTPTTFLSSSPTPTTFIGGSSGGGSELPPESGCEAYRDDIVDKAVISSTLCTVPSATPTTTP